MQAAVLIEPRHFEIRNVPEPEVGSGDVLIKVSQCGICGTDLHIFNGNYSAEHLPLIPGHEFSGSIAEVGAKVNDISVDDNVTTDINIGCGSCFYCRKNEVLNCPEVRQIGIHVDGGFAEYVSVPARNVRRVSKKTPLERAGMTEPLSCVVRSFRKAGLSFGHSVAIIGAGPIGLLHTQMAKTIGAAPVVVVEIDPTRASMARSMGADLVVQDPGDAANAIRAVTEGRGADFVIECVGRAELYRQARDMVRPGGRIVAFGLATVGDCAPIEPLELVMKELTLGGSVAGMGDDVSDALRLLEFDRLDVTDFTSHQVPLKEIQNAFERFETDKSLMKVQIRIS